MNIIDKLIDDLILEIAGKEVVPLVNLIKNKSNVSEFKLAARLKLSVNQVRNMLYRLNNFNLVDFTRKKDKTKGWYIYFWTLNTEKCLIKIEQVIIKALENLNNLLKNRESKRFYTCETCNLEVSEETALENDFSCQECGEVYKLSDNSDSIKEAKSMIARKERELKIIQEEIIKARELSQKKKPQAKKQKKKPSQKKKPGKKPTKKPSKKK